MRKIKTIGNTRSQSRIINLIDIWFLQDVAYYSTVSIKNCQKTSLTPSSNFLIYHFCFLWNFSSLTTGCLKKHGNSVTNSISSLLWISIVIPNFKSHNIIMSARVYFMKTVNGCKDVSIMSLQDTQWKRTSLLCWDTVIFLFY